MSQSSSSSTERPSVRAHILSVPKEGAGREEYEDAAAVKDETWPVRAAVADGATESAFAGAWAETLAEGLASVAATPEALEEALPDWQSDWADSFSQRVDSLPWYGAAKAREGAFATLLGLEICPDGRWRAVSVGDGLLVHLREETLRDTWPHTSPDAFTNRPALLASRADRSGDVPEHCRATTGQWEAGDTFLLATDAVGAWLLRTGQDESSSGECRALAAVSAWSDEAFRTAVTDARADGRLRNDDSTLLVLDMNGSPTSGT